MAPDSTKPNDTENQKSLDQEVREMISTLTTRLGSIQRSQKSGSSSTQITHDTSNNKDDDDQGVRIITLAGTNLGATMRGETTDEKIVGPQGGPDLPEHEDFATYVNSNFQAINNSIMFGGSYTTNDPGVHLDITDYLGRDDDDVSKSNGKKVPRRNNKRGSYKSDNLIERSDKNTSDGERS